MATKKVKLPKCKNPSCGKEFERFYTTTQSVCSIKCSKELSILKIQQKIEKQLWETNDPIKIKERFDKADKAIHDKGWHEKILEAEINGICRLIDKGSNCISCTVLATAAGHYHSVKSNGALRYNLHNLHAQEYTCNNEKGANIIQYNKGLIERYGKKYKEYVECDIVRIYPKLGLHTFEIQALIKKARVVRKRLIKEDKIYPISKRIELRDMVNQEIGIYQSNYLK